MLGRLTNSAVLLVVALGFFFVLAITSGAFAQDPGVPDSMIIGNLDGSLILAGLNTEIVVPVYIRTDDSVNFVHIPVGTDDDYISSRDGGVFYPPLSLWDDVSFLAPDIDNPSVGYTSQSILGFAYLFDPRDPQNFLLTNGQWVHIADFHFTSTDNVGILGDTTDIIEGNNPANGNLYLGLSDGTSIVFPEVVWGKIYFPPNTPPAFTEPLGGTYALNEQFGICFNVSAADEDDDNLVLTVDFGPDDYTLEELINVPGDVSYEFCWVPAEGTAGSYPLTITVNDGNGGVVNLNIVFEVTPTGLVIASTSTLPGTVISLPISLNNEGVSSAVGGFEINVSWNPIAMDLTGVLRAGRIGDFEYFHVHENDLDQGIARIVGIADINNGDRTPPLSPGTGPIIYMDFAISSDEDLIGVELPVSFLCLDQSDNTLSDSTGYLLVHPELTDGIVEIIGPDDVLTGDINLNGVPYEVADVVLFVNHIVNPDGYPFNPIQLEASDINADGLPATVADLVLLINIVTGVVLPPKLEPADHNLLVRIQPDNGKIEFRAETDIELGAVLIKLAHETGAELQPIANGELSIAYYDDGEVLAVLAYLPGGGGIAAGMSDLFYINEYNGELQVSEISAADGFGNLLNSVSRLEAPIPSEYELSQNYPNPFNANTKISFGLPEPGQIQLEIFNITGQKVGTLLDGYFEAGRYDLVWDGTDSNGQIVSSGVYFYRLQTGTVAKTMKMTLLK